MSFSVPFSSPLLVFTTIISGVIYGEAFFATSLTYGEGIPSKTISLPFMHEISGFKFMLSGIFTPGSFDLCSPSFFISSNSFEKADHTVTV